MKKLRKSVNICQSYHKNKRVSFFYGPQCIFHSTDINSQGLKLLRGVLTLWLIQRWKLGWWYWAQFLSGHTSMFHLGSKIQVHQMYAIATTRYHMVAEIYDTLQCVQRAQLHVFTFSSPKLMWKFTRKLQWMFLRNGEFCHVNSCNLWLQLMALPVEWYWQHY